MPRLKTLKPHVVIYETEYVWPDDTDQPETIGEVKRTLESCVPDEWDLEDGLTAVDVAVKVLNGLPCAFEPDCIPGTPDWFSGTDANSLDRHFRTGSWDEYSVHLYGFKAFQRTAILRKYNER